MAIIALTTSFDQDQAAQNVQSDLDLHCPLWRNKLNNKKIIFLSLIRVENIVGKGENANQHFLIFPQCIQKLCFQGASKVVDVWEWVNWVKKYTVGKG